MRSPHLLRTLLMAVPTLGQFSNWQENQVNTSLCYWMQPRAALLRDTVWIDGGTIEWSAGLNDGSYTTIRDLGNEAGYILSYNLSQPFDKDTNKTRLMLQNKISKARGGTGNNNGGWPNAIDGGMLANDHEFFLYGGVMTRLAEHLRHPNSDAVLAYRVYQYGHERQKFQKAFEDTVLGEEVNRYIAYGATVNAPSENKAWYFSGLTSESHGPIYTNAGRNDSLRANEVSDRLITLDLEDQYREEWSNSTLPPHIPGRSNAEVVWVPVGEQGILVVLGGVTYPEWSGRLGSPDEEASREESPEFMRVIDIYDVASRKWFKQPTVKGPRTRTRGCAVVAPSSDKTSFNIYYYGGYDGLNTDEISDEVWVLSLPSFTWTLVNKGESIHARAGHKCFMPYPDQMLVFGGYVPQVAGARRCLKDGPIVNFNLTSGEWMDTYHPNDHAQYGVPEAVQQTIGGDALGAATADEPVPSGWQNSSLADIFATKYDMDKIKTYGPYPLAESDGGRPNLPGDDDNGGGGGGLPSWVAPVLGVVLGLILLSGVLVFYCLWRKRKALKNGSTVYGTENPRLRIMNWLNRSPPPEKAVTVTTTEEVPPSSPGMGHSRMASTDPSFGPSPIPQNRVEAAEGALHELADTSQPGELSDTGLSHNEVIQKHSRFASNQSNSISSPSHDSFSFVPASSVSRSSGFGSAGDGRMDSPPLVATPDLDARVTTGFGDHEAMNDAEKSAAVTEIEIRPQATRQLSELSAQSMADPISPPTAGDAAGDDYITARAVLVSPVRAAPPEDVASRRT